MRTMNRILSILVIFACLLAGSDATSINAEADELTTLDRLGYLTLWDGNYDKYSPEIAYNSLHDEYLVVWENVQGPGGIHDIYARRVSGNGKILNWFCVFTGDIYVNITHHSQTPSVAYDSTNDRYLVTWSYFYGWVNPDNHNLGQDWDIRGRYVPWDGSGMDCASTAPVFPIAQESHIREAKPRVAYNSTGDEFLVVYQAASANNPKSFFAEIKGCIVKNGTNRKCVDISSQGIAERDFPDVAYNANRDQYLVVWDIYPSSMDVWAARLTADGDVMWGDPLYPDEFPLANTNVNEQHPTVAACSQSNQFLVVWQQPPPPPNPRTDDDLYGKYMSWWNPPGYYISPTSWIESSTAAQWEPDLTCNWAGTEYLVVWQDQAATPPGAPFEYGIWGKEIRTDQTRTNPFPIIATWGGKNREVPAAAGGKTSFLVAWEHQRNDDPSYRDIWGTILTNAAFLPVIKR